MRYSGNHSKGIYIHHKNHIQMNWEENIQHRMNREIFQAGDFSLALGMANGKIPIDTSASVP